VASLLPPGRARIAVMGGKVGQRWVDSGEMARFAIWTPNVLLNSICSAAVYTISSLDITLAIQQEKPAVICRSMGSVVGTITRDRVRHRQITR
jgi:hypothetical protein